jgi:signal transduction histidine kinase/DNA-binding response OmpR family regulator
MSELEGLKLLKRIEEGVAGKSGEAFFRQIVKDLAGALDAHAAFTSHLLPDRRAGMLAYWVGDRFEPCVEYSLAGTPCEFVYNGEITCHARDIGEIFPVDREWFAQLGVHSYLGLPIKNETGAVVGHLAVMDRRERDWHEADLDILRLFSLRTAVELERGRAQRLLEESNASLTSMNERLRREVEERLVMEKQLAAAKLAAETANRAKSIFISQMSHELRTPLNGILGYAQLLQRSGASLTESQRDGVRTIERSGEHLLNLVNDLLDLARIEAGKLELRVEAVDLPALLDHVTDLIRIRADKAGLAFHCERGHSLPRFVKTDARALRQILLNLLGNAVKFTHSGGSVALRVHSVERTAAWERLRFEIADSGSGIPSDQLQRIFEPFHRVAQPHRTVEGTGLGLAITHRLVSAMSGAIDVTSREGTGSTFSVTLTLPIHDAALEPQTLPGRITGYGGARRSIVVADDDEVNRTLVRELLEELGFEVRTASNGDLALQLVRLAPPDLLLTDLVMPVIDGMETVRVLRSDLQSRTLPVIAMSASASDFTTAEALQAGCQAFLAKPLRFPQLLEQIGELLGLEWHVAADGSAVSRIARQDCQELLQVDAAIARELHHLARLGDLSALIEHAERSLGADVTAAAFIDELRRLAERYDTGAIRRTLDARCPMQEGPV